jgi:hypothetical protein
MPEVQERFAKASRFAIEGMERARQAVRLVGNVAVLDLNHEGLPVDRYVPYHFHPQARYSIAIIHSEKGVSVTAMRNPWLDFESANLGQYMQKFGGGGHQRVGSLMLPKDRESESESVVSELLHELNSQI